MPPVTKTPAEAFRAFALLPAAAVVVELSAALEASACASPPQAPHVLPSWPAPWLLLALPPPVEMVNSPPLTRSVVAAWMASVPALITKVPPSIAT